MPKLAEIARAFDTTSATIRRWTADHAPFLSDGANPSPGTPRQYTDNDARVLALVATMRGKNLLLPDIDAALMDGERGEWPPASMADNGDGEGQETGLVVGRLTAELAHTSGQLTAVSKERDRLLASLEEERAAHLEALQVAATAPMLAQELERAREESERIRAELERARLPFWKRWGEK